MKKSGNQEDRQAQLKRLSEEYKRYDKKLDDLGEEWVAGKINKDTYNLQREALQKINPEYACYFSDNEPEWMKPITASQRDMITRKLALPSIEEDLARSIAKPIKAILFGSGITIIDLCIYVAIKFLPRQYHYIPMLSIPITNIPILYCFFSTWMSTTAEHKVRDEQLQHYRSLSTEQLLREAHKQNIYNARSKYTPDEVKM